MRHALDARVASEIRAFSLRFTCEACAHASPDHRCSLGYPNDEHRSTRVLEQAIEAGGGEGIHLTFCKEFELG